MLWAPRFGGGQPGGSEGQNQKSKKRSHQEQEGLTSSSSFLGLDWHLCWAFTHHSSLSLHWCHGEFEKERWKVSALEFRLSAEQAASSATFHSSSTPHFPSPQMSSPFPNLVNSMSTSSPLVSSLLKKRCLSSGPYHLYTLLAQWPPKWYPCWISEVMGEHAPSHPGWALPPQRVAQYQTGISTDLGLTQCESF